MNVIAYLLHQVGHGLEVASRTPVNWLRDRHAAWRGMVRIPPAGPLRLLVVLPRPLVAGDDLSSTAGLESEAPSGPESHGVPLRSPLAPLLPEHLDRAFGAQRAPLVIHYLHPPTLDALRAALSAGCHALLFDGYSREEGVLLLEGDYGVSRAIAARELGRLLRREGVRLVWLRTRHVPAAARALRQVGITVIGDTARCSDGELSAAALAACFAALSRGRNVHQALAAGRAVLAGSDAAVEAGDLGLYARRWPVPRLRRAGVQGVYRGEQVPPSAPPWISLVGREVDEALIHRRLAQHRVVTLVGEPGVGKTALARAVARWHWERKPDEVGIRFMSLRTLPRGTDLLDELLDGLLPGYRAPAGLGRARLRRHKISRLSARLGMERWLLVLDDVGALGDTTAAALLCKLLQRCTGLHLLLTANEDIAMVEGAVFPLGPLNLDAAVVLFGQQAGQSYDGQERIQVEAICKALACLPLAVVLVARSSSQRPADILAGLGSPSQDTSGDLEAEAGGVTNDVLQQPQTALQLALDYTYARLSLPARRLFCALTIFPSGAKAEALAAVLRILPDPGPALDELGQRGLVERNRVGEDWRYCLVPQVIGYAHQRFCREAEHLGLDRSLLRRTFAEHLLGRTRQLSELAAAGRSGPDAILLRPTEGIAGKTVVPPVPVQLLDGDRANLLGAVEEAYGTAAWEVTWKLAQNAAALLGSQFCGMGGERTYLLALNAARRRGDAREELETLGWIGDLYRRQGRLEEARACFKRALVICDELDDVGAQGQAQVALGGICADQGHWDEAAACYEEGVRTLRRAGDYRGEGRTLGILGHIYRRHGRWSEAIAVFQQALAALRPAGERQGEAEMLNAIARIYCLQGHWDEAVRMVGDSLRISRDVRDRCGERRALSSMGSIYYAQQRWTEAAACYEQDLVICRQLDNLYAEGWALSRIGLVSARRGQWSAAIRAEQEAVRIFRDLEDCHEQGRVQLVLSEVYRLQGRQAEAAAACRQARRFFFEAGRDRGVGRALLQQGRILAHDGHWGESISAYQEALQLFRRIQDRFGEGRTLARLGVAHARQGDWAEAGSVLRQALVVLRQLGHCRSEVQVLYNLGQVYTWQGRWTDAIACYERFLALRHVLADSRPERRVLRRLGHLYRYCERWKEAVGCYRQELALSRGLPDRLGEGKALANLADIYRRHRHWVRAIPLYESSGEIFREQRRYHNLGRAVTWLGLALAAQARWTEADRTLQEGLGMLRQLGDRYVEGKMRCRLARVHFDQDRWNQALDLYNQSLEIFRALGRRRSEARVWSELQAIYKLQGCWVEAIACGEQTLMLCRQTGDRWGEGRALSHLGDIHRRRGCWAEATAYYEQDLAIRRQEGDGVREGKALAALAAVHADEGNKPAALAAYQESLEVFRTVADEGAEAQVLTALGLVHAGQGDEGSAIACWYRALALYRSSRSPEAHQVRALLNQYLADDQAQGLLEMQMAVRPEEDDW